MQGLTKVLWSDISPLAQVTNPALKEIIDEISPSSNYPLYIGEYPYGALILDNGVFKVINDNNELVPLTHKSINSNAQYDLDYTNTIPVGMVLENSIETFFIDGNQAIPSTFYKKGGIVSLWSILEGISTYQAGSIWSISSGARTLCMLPKVTDKSGYIKLKRKYNLKDQVPKSLTEHWGVFRNIANHKNFSQPWKSKILYFSKYWFQHKNDKEWTKFYNFLLNMAWNDSTVKRNQFIVDFIFSLAQKNCGLKPNPYLIDTARHIISIGLGGAPGFKPATDNIAAPIAGLQKTYIADYGLTKIPTIMQPYHFSTSLSDRVYYSFEMPTTVSFSPRSNNGVSRMVDMRELKYIMDKLLSEILNCNLMVEKTPLFNLAKNIKYDFYHTDPDQHNEITQLKNIANINNNFTKILCDTSASLEPAEFSPFFRGCISLSAKSSIVT
ncbi:MAG: hypothetical protein K0R14_1866 [Burkholderiales bacterium]|jgi:hypothetical protein|nr:hypothetical protein [Burkholderiales bacterium]